MIFRLKVFYPACHTQPCIILSYTTLHNLVTSTFLDGWPVTSSSISWITICSVPNKLCFFYTSVLLVLCSQHLPSPLLLIHLTKSLLVIHSLLGHHFPSVFPCPIVRIRFLTSTFPKHPVLLHSLTILYWECVFVVADSKFFSYSLILSIIILIYMLSRWVTGSF